MLFSLSPVTYLLGHGNVLSRVVLARLLGVVRYRPLALGKLLGRRFVRHAELCCRRVEALEVLIRNVGYGNSSVRAKTRGNGFSTPVPNHG